MKPLILLALIVLALPAHAGSPGKGPDCVRWWTHALWGELIGGLDDPDKVRARALYNSTAHPGGEWLFESSVCGVSPEEAGSISGAEVSKAIR
jgi:hypothetical protein